MAPLMMMMGYTCTFEGLMTVSVKHKPQPCVAVVLKGGTSDAVGQLCRRNTRPVNKKKNQREKKTSCVGKVLGHNEPLE